MEILAASSLEVRLEEMRRLVDGILANPPTKLDLKRMLAAELDVDPKPEVLQAVSSLGELADPRGREIAVQALVVHLVIETSFAEAWGSRGPSLDRVRRCLEWMPSLIALHEDEQARFAAAVVTVDRSEREAVRRLRNGLVVADENLFAAGVVLAELERLAAAVHEDRLATVASSLEADEVEELAVAMTEAAQAARPDREVVTAIALRSLIGRSVARWRALPPEDGDDSACAAERLELRDGFEAQRRAYDVVSAELDALRSRRFQETLRPNGRLDRARKRLFAAFLDLKRALAGEHTEPADELRRMIGEAETVAAAIDAEQEKTKALMKEAATPVESSAVPVALAPDPRQPARERLRKKILFGIAAGLVPVALGMNIFFGSWGKAPTGLSVKDFEKALPLQEVAPVPGAIYSQVSSLLWESMTDSERIAKIDQVAQIARREGYAVLLVVDENNRELARSSVAGGTELFSSAPPDPFAAAKP